MNTATMNIFAIDTLQFSKRMQKAGLKKETVDELAEVIKETQSQSFENVATKQDIKLLKQDCTILKIVSKKIYKFLNKIFCLKSEELFMFVMV